MTRERNHCRIVDHQQRRHHHHRLNTAKGHNTLLCWKVKCIAHNHSESVTQSTSPHTIVGETDDGFEFRSELQLTIMLFTQTSLLPSIG